MDFQVEYVRSADGTDIAVGRGGAGPPLLVVPYMAGTIETTWAMLAEAFPDRELITYDRRGTGLSTRGTHTSAPEPYFEDVQAVLDQLELSSCAVLGTLLGTIEAAWLASHNPDRVTHLVLRSPLMIMADWAIIPGVRAGLAALEYDWEFFTEAFSQFVVGWGNPKARQLAARYRSVTTQDELRALFDAFASIDLEHLYGDIKASTLVEHHPDYFFPNAYSQRIASAIETCKISVFRGSDFINDLAIPSAFLDAERLPPLFPSTAATEDEAQESLESALAKHYVLEGELGTGGMATVYSATDRRHERRVAIKILRPELAAVIGAERFLNEIRVTANLQHPHILPLFDSGTVDGTPYYVMPQVAGESLRARIEQEHQLAISEVVTLTAKIAGALDYAHEQGVVHRDIKPENILLQHGEPMVADFGIALALTESGGERLTATGISIGTPAYMSPEQVSGDRVIDRQSDVYALGCVVYEMLVGEPPFTGPNVQAVMARQVTDTAPPIATVRPDVPSHITDAVRKALAKAPLDRFATAGAFAEALAGP